MVAVGLGGRGWAWKGGLGGARGFVGVGHTPLPVGLGRDQPTCKGDVTGIGPGSGYKQVLNILV